jgi:hypothetical protein
VLPIASLMRLNSLANQFKRTVSHVVCSFGPAKSRAVIAQAARKDQDLFALRHHLRGQIFHRWDFVSSGGCSIKMTTFAGHFRSALVISSVSFTLFIQDGRFAPGHSFSSFGQRLRCPWSKSRRVSAMPAVCHKITIPDSTCPSVVRFSIPSAICDVKSHFSLD